MRCFLLFQFFEVYVAYNSILVDTPFARTISLPSHFTLYIAQCAFLTLWVAELG